MPGLVDTPLDRISSAGSQTRQSNTRSPLAWKRGIQNGCLIFLIAGRFALSTLLITCGLPLFGFLFLGGWDLTGLAVQLDNFADHYLGAEPVRRLAFSSDCKVVFTSLVALVALARLPGVIGKLSRELEDPTLNGGRNA